MAAAETRRNVVRLSADDAVWEFTLDGWGDGWVLRIGGSPSSLGWFVRGSGSLSRCRSNATIAA
ncbi:hypothetical protein GCM10027586_08450 [Kineococcus gypseus]